MPEACNSFDHETQEIGEKRDVLSFWQPVTTQA